jgi:hypothetical protein
MSDHPIRAQETLRKALEECVEVLALVEHPRRIDPQYGQEVAALGYRIGFGALMSSASASWREYLVSNGMPAGSEFVAGPCHATVLSALKQARAALDGVSAAHTRSWECAARKSVLPEPADCNWPDCGCDDHATKVIASLLEQGWTDGSGRGYAPSPAEGAALSAQADVRAATIEECAKVAENVDDVLRGGCKSEDDEWLWTNGGREMQSDIAKAIRALSDAKQPEGK